MSEKERYDRLKMKFGADMVKIVRIGTVAKLKVPEREVKDIPIVNPRVTPEEAVRALKKTPGGEEIIAQLKQEGKKL